MRIKDYISYSQFVVFQRGEEAYRKAYIFGYKFESKYIKFGSKIHEALELRKANDEDERTAIEIIPRAQHGEVEISVVVDGVPIYGKIDGTTKTKKGYTIKEYKTSKGGWSQARADSSVQLTFYAIMMSSFYHIPIENIKIVLECLITYEDTDGVMHLTGEKQSFTTKRTQEDADKLMPKVKEAWVGIEKLVNEASKIKQ